VDRKNAKSSVVLWFGRSGHHHGGWAFGSGTPEPYVAEEERRQVVKELRKDKRKTVREKGGERFFWITDGDDAIQKRVPAPWPRRGE